MPSTSGRPLDPRLPGVAYARFLAGATSWSLAFGMQALVFQWLVVDTLQERPARVGLAQTAALLPSVVLLLVGGATADRVDRRRLLVWLHVAAAALFLGVAGVAAAGLLTYELLIGFALALGSVTAFGLPARDGQLWDVAGGSLSRAVVGANVTQQGGQVLGALLAGTLAGVGVAFVLTVQAILVLAGALPVARLPESRVHSERPASLLRDARAGFAVVWTLPVLRGVLVLTVCIGLFFVGPYSVILPLLVRDTYGGGAAQLGVLIAMLPLGGILGGVAVFARGGLRRNGRALLAGQAGAAACIAGLGGGPSFVGAALLVALWGVCSALFLNAGRTLFHAAAPDAHRSKLLALYTFGIMGAGPAGALLSGLLAEAWGTAVALQLQGAAMGLAVAGVAVSGALREA
jgi:MFS family permease